MKISDLKTFKIKKNYLTYFRRHYTIFHMKYGTFHAQRQFKGTYINKKQSKQTG